MKVLAKWFDYALLVVTLVVVVGLYYAFYHGLAIYAVDLAKTTTSVQEFCTLIDYYGECEVHDVYPWLLSRLLWSDQARPALVALATVSVFLLARKIYGSPYVASLSAVLFLSTPAILAGIRDYHGLFYTSMLLPVAFVLLYSGVERGFKSTATLGGLALYALLLLHPAHFVLALALSILAVYTAVHSISTSRVERVLYAVVVLNAILLFLHVFDIVDYVGFSLASVAVVGLSIAFSRYLRGFTRASYVAIALLGYVGLSAMVVVFEQVYLSEVALEFQDPVRFWGLTGILCLPGILLAIRRKTGLAEKYLATLTLVLAPLTLFGVYVTPLFNATTSTITSRLLEELYVLTRSGGLRLSYRLTKLVPVGIVLVTVISAYTGSWLIASELSLINTPFEDVMLVTRDRSILKRFYEQLLEVEEELANLIASNVTGRVLVLALPANAYWVASLASRHGVPVQLVSTPYSGTGSQALLAKVLTSEEDTAVLMLKEIASSLKVVDTYVVVVFPYSERHVDGSLYIGVPREARMPGLRYPVLVFEALGDIASIPWLLRRANRTIGDYLQILASPELERAQPLFWTVKGSRTLLVQLMLKSFDARGVKARNYNVGFEPDVTLRYFDLVYVKSLEVANVTTVYYGTYRVYYMVSVFRLKGDGVGTT